MHAAHCGFYQFSGVALGAFDKKADEFHTTVQNS
jgi:hypothetical protein